MSLVGNQDPLFGLVPFPVCTIDCRQRISRKNVLFDWPAALHMFHQNPFKHLFGGGMVPSAIGVHDGDRALFAHAQAIHL